jgi:HSP20 family protein
MLTLWNNSSNGLAAIAAEMMKDLASPSAGAWVGYGLTPAADVLETETGFKVVLDLPGLDPKALAIQVENDVLSVQAERSQPANGDATLHRSERAFGTFQRSFSLPKSVDASRVSARYEHGVLTVELPKREEAKPRTIQVSVK